MRLCTKTISCTQMSSSAQKVFGLYIENKLPKRSIYILWLLVIPLLVCIVPPRADAEMLRLSFPCFVEVTKCTMPHFVECPVYETSLDNQPFLSNHNILIDHILLKWGREGCGSKTCRWIYDLPSLTLFKIATFIKEKHILPTEDALRFFHRRGSAFIHNPGYITGWLFASVVKSNNNVQFFACNWCSIKFCITRTQPGPLIGHEGLPGYLVRTFRAFSRQFIGVLGSFGLESCNLNSSLRETQGVLSETPLPIGNSSLHGSYNNQQKIESCLKTFERRPATPKSQLVGAFLFMLGVICAALGTYNVGIGRLSLVLLFWVLTFVLIHLGLNELFFGDGPISSFL